jgi:hypothetical protein
MRYHQPEWELHQHKIVSSASLINQTLDCNNKTWECHLSSYLVAHPTYYVQPTY